MRVVILLCTFLPFIDYNDELAHFGKVMAGKLVNYLSQEIDIRKCDVVNNHELLLNIMSCV